MVLLAGASCWESRWVFQNRGVSVLARVFPGSSAVASTVFTVAIPAVLVWLSTAWFALPAAIPRLRASSLSLCGSSPSRSGLRTAAGLRS